MAVLSADTVEDGLKTCHISKASFYTWMKQEDFRQEYENRRRELIEQSYRVLERTLTKAAETLKSLLNSKSESVKRQTAVNVFDLFAKRVEQAEILERLARLEATLEKKN